MGQNDIKEQSVYFDIIMHGIHNIYMYMLGLNPGKAMLAQRHLGTFAQLRTVLK
jgi:hypothetical protein